MAIEFVQNYTDLSTDKGYQFKFFCDKCGNGYMSSFRASAIGIASSAAQVAGSLFGGVFGKIGSSSYEVQRAIGGPAHDKALEAAVTEMKPKFKQCSRCGKWVCGEVCWNHEQNLCEQCAPNLDEEIASAQADGGPRSGLREGEDGGLAEGPRHLPQAGGGVPLLRGAHAGRQVLPLLRRQSLAGRQLLQVRDEDRGGPEVLSRVRQQARLTRPVILRSGATKNLLQSNG